MSTVLRSLMPEAPVRAELDGRRSFPWLVASVALFATLVSLTGSWIPSLWGDEAASVMSATRSVPSLWSMLSTVDAVHGAYYLGLHVWVDIFGASAFALRLPSALMVGATVAGVMVLARRLGSVRVAVAAGLICAVLPRVTYMGSEARSSAFAAAIVSWLTVVLVEILVRRSVSRPWWVVYSVLLMVGIYVFLYVALIVLAHALVLVSMRTRGRVVARWAWSVAAAVVAAGPVIVFAVRERGQIAFLAHRAEVSFSKVAVSVWFGQPIFAVLAWVLIFCALVAAFTDWRARRLKPPINGARLPRLDVVAASWLLVPAVILIGGFATVPVYTARYLSYCAPAAALLMAIGLDWLGRRRPRLIASGLVLIVLCSVPVWASQRQPNAKDNSDFAQTSAIIAAHASPGDGIAFDETVRPSRKPRLALHLYPDAFVGLKDVTLNVAYSAGTSWSDTAYDISDAAALGRLDGIDRLWLIAYAGTGTPDPVDRSALQQLGYTVEQQYITHRSTIYEYVRTPAGP